MKQRLEEIRKFLIENGLMAIKTLGPVELKLKADGSDLVRKVVVHKALLKKTNLVLSVENIRQKELIAKSSLHLRDKLRSQQLRNEILFYEKVAPALRRQWEKIYPREEMPVVNKFEIRNSKFETNPKFLPRRQAGKIQSTKQIQNQKSKVGVLVTEKAAGRNLGEAFELGNKEVVLAHLKRAVDFLFLVQAMTVAEAKKMGLVLKKSLSNYDDYQKMFKARKGDLKKIFGQEFVAKLARELEIKEQFLRRGQEIFGNSEVNCDGIYTTNRTNKTNKIGVKIVDWDVLQKIGNPAGQFSYLLTAFWPNPKLQQKLMDYIIEKGRLTYPGFAEYLRLDILLFRGTGILWRHYWKKRGRQNGFKKLKRWLEGLIE